MRIEICIGLHSEQDRRDIEDFSKHLQNVIEDFVRRYALIRIKEITVDFDTKDAL